MEIEVPTKKEIRKFCTLRNNPYDNVRSFISFNAKDVDNMCTLYIDEKRQYSINFLFDIDSTQIIAMDARLVPDLNEVEVRVAIIKDQEKLSLFTYRDTIRAPEELMLK